MASFRYTMTYQLYLELLLLYYWLVLARIRALGPMQLALELELVYLVVGGKAM